MSDAKIIKKLTKAQLLETAGLLIHGDRDQLKLVYDDPKAPVLKAMIAGVALRIIETKDMAALQSLLDRLIGRVKEVMDLNVDDDRRRDLTPEQIEQRIARLAAERKKVLEYDI